MTNWRHYQSDFYMGVLGMRWDPDHMEWVWPERLPASLSWFMPYPPIDEVHIPRMWDHRCSETGQDQALMVGITCWCGESHGG